MYMQIIKIHNSSKVVDFFVVKMSQRSDYWGINAQDNNDVFLNIQYLKFYYDILL